MKLNKVLTKKWDKFPYIGHGLTGGIEIVLSLMIISLGIVDFMLFRSRVDEDTRQVPDTPHKFLYYFLSPANHTDILYTHQMLTVSGAPTWSGLWLLVTGSVGTFIGCKRRKLNALRFTEMIYFIMNLISALVLSPLTCYIAIAIAYFRYKLDNESKSLIWLLPLVLGILLVFQLLLSVLTALVCYCSDRRFSPVHVLVKKKDLEKLSELTTTTSSGPKPEVKDMGQQANLLEANNSKITTSEDKEIQTSGLAVASDTTPVVVAPAPAPAPAPVLQPQIAYPMAPLPPQSWGNFPQQPSNSSTQVNIYMQDIAGRKTNIDPVVVDEGSRTPPKQIKVKTCEMAAQTDYSLKETPSSIREVFPKSSRRVREKLVQTSYAPVKRKPQQKTTSYVVENDSIDKRKVQKQDEVLKYEDVSEDEDENTHPIQNRRRNDVFVAPPALIENQSSIIRESTKPVQIENDGEQQVPKSRINEDESAVVYDDQKDWTKLSEGERLSLETPIADDTVLYDLEELSQPNEQIDFDNKRNKSTEETGTDPIEVGDDKERNKDLKKISTNANTEKMSMAEEDVEAESKNGDFPLNENSREVKKSSENINTLSISSEPNESQITKPKEQNKQDSHSNVGAEIKVSLPTAELNSSEIRIEKETALNVNKSNIQNKERTTKQNVNVGDNDEKVTNNTPKHMRHLHAPQARGLPLEDGALENVSKSSQRKNAKHPKQISVQPSSEDQSRSPSSNKSYSLLRKLMIPQR